MGCEHARTILDTICPTKLCADCGEALEFYVIYEGWVPELDPAGVWLWDRRGYLRTPSPGSETPPSPVSSTTPGS